MNKIKAHTFAADSMEEFQMVHGHLKDLSFLQLRWALLHEATLFLARLPEAILLILNIEIPASQKHWAPASWALTGCGWSDLYVSSQWSVQQSEETVKADKLQKANKQKKKNCYPETAYPSSLLSGQNLWRAAGRHGSCDRADREGDGWGTKTHGAFDAAAYCYHYPP